MIDPGALQKRAGGRRVAGLCSGLAGIGLVGLIDWGTGPDIAVSIFYVLPIALGVWFAGRWVGLGLSVLAAVVWLRLDVAGGHVYSHVLVPYWNASVRLGFFALVTLLLDRVRFLATHLEAMVRERTASLLVEVERRRQVEEGMREREERFRQVVEHIREVFWMSDAAKNQILYVSPAYEEIWGRSCASLLASPRDWLEAIHPEDRERVLSAALTKQTRGEYNEVYRILRPDGSMRWIEDRAFPIRNEAGAVYRLVGIAEDITGRHLAGEALRASEARKNAIVDSALDCILTIDHQGRIIEFNSAAERVFGYTRAEVVGKEMAEVIVPPSLRERHRHGLAHYLPAGEGPVLGKSIEMTALRADGTEFPIEMAITSVALDGPPMFTGFIRDLTQRKQAETQLTTLAHAIESTTELICITDLQDRFTFVNRAFQRTFGYTAAEILGKTPEILFSPNNPPELMAEILEQTRLGGWQGEVLDQRKDGTEFPVFLSTSQITDAAGRVIGLIGVAQDITERKRAEAVFRESEDRFRTLFESAPFGLALHGLDGRIIQTNRAYQEITGYSSEELRRLGVRRITHPDDVAEGQRLYQELREGQRDHYQRVKRYRRKDDRIVWARATASAIRAPGGGLRFIVSMVEDITTRKRAEECAAAFARLSRQLSVTTTSAEAAGVIVATASELFGWDACYLHLYSPERQEIVPVLTMDTVNGRKVEIPQASFTLDPSPLMLEVMGKGARLINRDARSSAAADAVSLVPFGDTARRSSSMMYVPIRHASRVVGILSLQSYTPLAYQHEDLDTLQAMANDVGGALERIHAAANARRLEQEIVEMSEREQRRIGHELHDGLGSFLGGIALKAKVLEQTLRDEHRPHAPEAHIVVKLLNDAVGETRRLARGFAPVELEVYGLVSALEKLSRETESAFGVQCIFTCAPPTLDVDLATALHLYRMTQEAVHNAIHHGQARRIEVDLNGATSQLSLTIRDDGKGFEIDAPGRTGMGLRIMEHRCKAIGGELKLSSRPNDGTEIRCVVSGWCNHAENQKKPAS